MLYLAALSNNLSIDGVKPNKLIAQFGTSFKQDSKTKVSTYYKNQAKALKIMTEAGWN